MKRYYFILYTAICCTALTSCKKYLDVKQNSRLSLISTTANCIQILNDGNLNRSFPTDGEISADNYYLTDADWSAMTPDARDLYVWGPNSQRLTANRNTQWVSNYGSVYAANVVLESLEKIDRNTNPAEYDLAKGSALFFRAMRTYKLAVVYALAYDAATANQDLGVPVRLSSSISDEISRATVQATYTQIINDLKDAISLLPNIADVPARPNKAAAYGTLAAVNLAMRNYTEAGAAANSSLQINSSLLNYSTADVNSDYPFTILNKEVLFHSTMYTINLSKPKADLILYNSYQANDLRKQLYFRSNGDGTYNFKAGYTDDINTPFDGIAVDEVYLIRAECYARAGNTSAAMNDLNTLLKTRWSGTYTDLTAGSAQEALDIILRERRKELIYRGTRWMDLKRLNKESRYAVTLSRTVSGATYTLPPNDLRYAVLLPEEVTTANSKNIQNPR